MAMDAAAAMLKRKVAEAPEPWLLDGVPVPATKIRRLDAEVPPVEPGAGVPPPPQQPIFGVEELRMCGEEAAPAVGVSVGPVAVNEERAIVVYQPTEAARNLLLGPLRPGVPLRVNPDWIRGLKSTMLKEASNHRALFEESRDDNPNLAMVPWSPAQAQAASSSTAAGEEMMDADQDCDGASMDVDHDGSGQPAPPTGVAPQGEAFHLQPQHQQWPPQHCMAPPQQLPAASYQTSPVSWSW
ncbi:uncharacterized protein LOC133901241 [Phragmites australis]|uniref:uncharacterized protein LOC133901241 n=1 Tax=Phragmites australis TaxID=29695 RepID=UPI002D786B3B|nr:uncharacterized protein LOC133901241 [Phragmites australis]